jgi:hypothetical protein
MATALKRLRSAEDMVRTAVQERLHMVEKVRPLCAPNCTAELSKDMTIARSHVRASFGNTQLDFTIGIPGAVLSGLAIIATAMLLVGIFPLCDSQSNKSE